MWAMTTQHTSPPVGSRHTSRRTSYGAGQDAGGPHYLARALAVEVCGDGRVATAPDWIQIFPAGPNLAALDGRDFLMSDPQAFVDAQRVSKARPILVDYDHLSAFNPEAGGDQTASGWIEALEVRNGEVWARVAWTVHAARQIADRQWRFVSPEFRVDRASGEIATLDAVALVNRPAFEMTALARANTTNPEDTPEDTPGDRPMLKEIASAPGLAEDATQSDTQKTAQETAWAAQAAAQAATRTATRTATPSTTPSTRDFMPRADYDRVLARAEAAEGELARARERARRDEVETLIAAAVSAGKIAPVSKDHYVALAMAGADGFEQVRQLTATLPRIADPSKLDDKAASAKGAIRGSIRGLSDADREMCACLGVSEEEYARQLATDTAGKE